ncbi:MAG TPA: hypothetical protein VKM55_21890 [Candidatus Lokiarchaeia archaeon]|nr:hypothetical protein [Candidatus Lokiarchaeia archaeon]
MPGRYRRPRRGYPVAVLLYVEDRRATLWMVNSESIAPAGNVHAGQKGSVGTANPKYNYFDDIVKTLKSNFATGVKTLVITGIKNTSLASDFLFHVQKHHAYLFKKGSALAINASIMEGEASNVQSALALVKGDAFRKITASTVDKEMNSTLELLDACINNPSGAVKICFTIDEIDQVFLAMKDDEGPVPEYILMTDEFYALHKSEAQFQRIYALAKRFKIKTRVIQKKTDAGFRVTELGGLVSFMADELH